MLNTNKKNLENQISCKSAGISAIENQSADSNISIINLRSHKSHKIRDEDFSNYNYLIALDESVRVFLESKKYLNSNINIMLLKDYDDNQDNEANIRDPYDIDGNLDKKLEKQMFGTIERCCKNLLECLESEIYTR
ncbi:MAG: hypothetical protein U0354_14230 [Candidatus Sericytochromatia bacterium]